MNLRGLTSLIFLFIFCVGFANAQDMVRITGKVTDASNGLPLPFVDVFFMGTYTGTSTDLNGKYVLETNFPSDTMLVTFLGYEPQKFSINLKEKRHNIDVVLQEESIVAQEVTIRAKRRRYKKKGNPAVELIRKVIANKERNHIEKKPYYNYNQHEKISLDVNNIKEKFTERKVLGKFDFLWNYLDTSTVNGKVFLPIYMREVLSTVYYRKNPKAKKERRHAIKMTQFDEALDDESISNVVDLLYQDINFYENGINILDNDFLSPISGFAPNYYRYYIQDTTELHGNPVIRMSFIPSNKSLIGFTGDLYISNDDRYTLLKVDLGVTRQISINYLRDIKVLQEFIEKDGVYIKSIDEITLDVSLTKSSLGAFANRYVSYSDFNFDPPPNDSIYGGIEEVYVADDAFDKSTEYWENNRISPLTAKEKGLTEMVDKLVTTPAYQKTVWWGNLFATGMIPIGPIDLGSITYFFSANDVEGFRIRLGGETRFEHFSKKVQMEAFTAYGFKDKRWKYRGSLLYSFNDDYKQNPKHFIEGIYRRDVIFPGLKSIYNQTDHFFTTFGRGSRTKMLFIDSYKFDYVKEASFGSLELNFERRRREPYGSLIFNRFIGDTEVFQSDITTSELGIGVEFSPNTTYIQGRDRRTPIVSNFPIVKIRYGLGIKNLFGAEHAYHDLSIYLTKRVSMSIVGRAEIELELGRVFGKELPYPILYIPQGNQSYSFSRLSFNLMNFLEFSTDKYARFYMQHFFDGFIFNRIPLWNKLKLKEVITFKAIYGGLDADNDPRKNPELIQFPVDQNGNPTTFAFSKNVPYIEYGVGVYNIFKVLRFDLLKRVNYLEHPDVPMLFGRKGLAVRASFKLEF